ncbi:MAG: SpoIIE family protein phosphatase [Ignavibacteriaceae bacterium]
MKRTKILLLFLASVAISYFIFRNFYIETHSLGGLKLTNDPESIEQKAAILAGELDLDINGASIKAELSSDEEMIIYVQDKFGVNMGNHYLRDSLPGYFWTAKFQAKGVPGVRFSNESGKDKKFEQYLDEIKLSYDSKGNLLHFSRPMEDSVTLPKISGEEAKIIAEDFIMKYSFPGGISLKDTSIDKKTKGEHVIVLGFNDKGYDYRDIKKIERSNRTDYEFAWTGETGFKELKKTINISVAGNRVNYFSFDYQIDEKFTEKADTSLYNILSNVLFYIVIFILLAVIAFRRIRAYEIGFRLAFILGIISALCVGVEIYLELNTGFTWELLVPLIAGPIFLGAGVVLVWAASETITREVWKEKFISIDLATKGYVLHSKAGSAVITGMSYGLLAASGFLILLNIFENLLGVSVVIENNDFLKHFNSLSPAFSLLLRNIYSGIFMVGIFFVFIVSGLKRRFTALPVLIGLCGLLWGITNVEDMQPLYWGILFETLLGITFVFIFIKTDVLVTLFTIISYYTINIAYSLLTIDNVTYSQEGYVLIVILLLTFLISSISFFTKDKVTEYDSITPAFAKNITERQRLQRELEIARDVQMSFLPKSIPSFPGIEVASRCIPALEVGGDYYDFVKLNDNLFGIIIGDVSGKGTQAAFYMTLTKGFLKALSRTSESPAVVLTKMNELFFENVERGTFISMIYGIFDKEKKIFRLARAGHNPVIVSAKGSNAANIEMLNPTGLALGLEKGPLFSKTIKEMEIPFALGDIFIFYTDGFTEAMNKQKEEFGEDRLRDIVERVSNLSAQEILEYIFKYVKDFMGKASQHDDMTMVVVKVNN